MGIDSEEGCREGEDGIADEEEVCIRTLPPQGILQHERRDEVDRCRSTEPHEEPREAFSVEG